MSYIATHTSLSPIRRGFAPGFVNYKTGALDPQPQVIKFTSCLPMVGGSLRVFRLLPPLKVVAMILVEVALSTQKNQINYVSHVPLFIKPHYHVPKLLLITSLIQNIYLVVSTFYFSLEIEHA